MMRSNISRLAVLGLAAVSSPVFAAVNLSGQVRLDTKFVSEPSGTDDSMELSRVRLNISGDVASDWTAHVRLEGSASDGNVDLQRAYASWTGLENMAVKIGRAGHISTSVDDAYYAPYTQWHGVLSNFDTNDEGVSLTGSMGAFGYGLGIVNGDNAASSDSLSWSMGGRANFTAMNSDKMAWGAGLGYVSLQKAKKELAVSEDNGTTIDSVIFDDFSGTTFDVSGVMGKIGLSGAYYSAKDKFVETQDANDAVQTTNTLSPFEKDGKQSSYYLEASYLVMGDGYGFGSGVISGPQFKSSALELGARVSRMKKEGLSARYDSTTDTYTAYTQNAAFLSTDVYEVKTSGTSIFANYHVNSNAVVKVELFNDKVKTTDVASGGASTSDVKNKHLSVRAQFSF